MLLSLVRRGYGSLAELKQLDTPELLDIVEFEQIANAIEAHEMEQARNGHS